MLTFEIPGDPVAKAAPAFTPQPRPRSTKPALRFLPNRPWLAAR